ncbi:MAG: hypothetical protein LBR79_05035 [Oscillospiraceae bacterium]|nr:hypothetical protein [Oscillospiraceae bacterium]
MFELLSPLSAGKELQEFIHFKINYYKTLLKKWHLYIFPPPRVGGESKPNTHQIFNLFGLIPRPSWRVKM